MKQAKRIAAMMLCLLALLALPAGAVMEKGEPNITARTTMKEVRNNPGIKNSGFYTYSQDKDCPPGQALWRWPLWRATPTSMWPKAVPRG